MHNIGRGGDYMSHRRIWLAYMDRLIFSNRCEHIACVRDKNHYSFNTIPSTLKQQHKSPNRINWICRRKLSIQKEASLMLIYFMVSGCEAGMFNSASLCSKYLYDQNELLGTAATNKPLCLSWTLWNIISEWGSRLRYISRLQCRSHERKIVLKSVY